MILVFQIIAFLVVMLIAQEAFRRLPAWVALVAFTVLPVLMTPYWLSLHRDVGVFPWTKLYSLVVSVSWLTALRTMKLGKRRKPVVGLVFLLAVNIVEAVAVDAVGGHLAHWLVMLSGILLLVTLPSPRGAHMEPLRDDSEYLYPAMSRGWVVEYTIWNWSFLFLNFPIVVAQQTSVLLASLIVGLICPARWLEARGYSLATSLLLMATFPAVMLGRFDATWWRTPWREDVVSILCIVIAVATTMRSMRTKQHSDPTQNKSDTIEPLEAAASNDERIRKSQEISRSKSAQQFANRIMSRICQR